MADQRFLICYQRIPGIKDTPVVVSITGESSSHWIVARCTKTGRPAPEKGLVRVHKGACSSITFKTFRDAKKTAATLEASKAHG